MLQMKTKKKKTTSEMCEGDLFNLFSLLECKYSIYLVYFSEYAKPKRSIIVIGRVVWGRSANCSKSLSA